MDKKEKIFFLTTQQRFKVQKYVFLQYVDVI